jgi:molecular chaperone Hsp33
MPAPDPASAPVDTDAWNRVGHLLATLTSDELLDLPVDELLFRFFHEEQVLLQPATSLRFQCSCSRVRVLGMIHALGAEQAAEVLDQDGQAKVTCEFCNRTYRIDQVDVAAVHAGRPLAPGSATPQ